MNIATSWANLPFWLAFPGRAYLTKFVPKIKGFITCICILTPRLYCPIVGQSPLNRLYAGFMLVTRTKIHKLAQLPNGPIKYITYSYPQAFKSTIMLKQCLAIYPQTGNINFQLGSVLKIDCFSRLIHSSLPVTVINLSFEVPLAPNRVAWQQ